MNSDAVLAQLAESRRRDLVVRLDEAQRHGRAAPAAARRRPVRGSAEHRIEAPADRVFAAVTDIGRLPEWNDLMAEVVERPPVLARGAVWRIRMRSGALTWVSRSEVRTYDAVARRFAYRSATDDGNPSFAEWTWEVRPDGPGACVVRVSWTLRPETFWRRALLVRVRSRALRREVPASLRALAAYVDGAASAKRQRRASSGWPARSNATAA